MKISYSWLKEHISLDLPAQDLALRLDGLGIEVAGIERRGAGFSGVVVAQILEIAKHPNADRLSLCVVSDGNAKLSIVCGAKNVAVGQKVPLARLGAKLPGGREITPANIRGVESQGMICSGAELGLSGSPDGIMVLEPGTEVGSDVARSLGPSDDVFDLEITPNRPDLLSHLGLARELSAYFRLPLKASPAPALPPLQGEAPPVSVEAPAACPRYVGRVLTGLEVGPSPGWLASRLEAVGLRPINNLVDITNFVLMDSGQPLHAFDRDKLEGGKVSVRFAKAGERLKALDGKDYSLTPDCLVIADAKRPVAVAGVMGGLESAVTEKTKACFLESAHFAPSVVRRTSQALRLRSDSSYRFERGADLEAAEPASQRASELIGRHCGRQVRSSAPTDSGRKTRETSSITFTARRVNEILGSSFQEEAVAKTLKAISAGFTASGQDLRFTPPSYRWDLETPWDLAEEAARLLGYDNIKPRLCSSPVRASRLAPAQALAQRLRSRLAAAGLCEAYNYDFVAEKTLKASRLEDDGWARIANPLSEDWLVLRPSLLPGLLVNASSNLNHGASSVRLFELGKTYRRADKTVEERSRAAGLLLGPTSETFWKAERCPDSGFYDAKGLLADLLSGIPGIEWLPMKDARAGRTSSDPVFHPASSLRLIAPRGILGTVGLLHPQAARAWELERKVVALFVLDLDILVELGPTASGFAPFGLLPASRRDLSIVLDRQRPYAEVETAVRSCGIAELKSLELVDLFEGKGIPEGKRSLTLRLTFSAADRTLKDAEVNAAVEKVLGALKSKLGAVLRS